MKTTLAAVLLLISASLAVAGRIKPLQKARIHGSDDVYAPLIKVPETLSVASSHHGLPSIVDDHEYNMVSLDGNHVGYIAANRLYYHRIPHQRMVLQLQDIRESNGLPRHLLESIRPFFPFFVDY